MCIRNSVQAAKARAEHPRPKIGEQVSVLRIEFDDDDGVAGTEVTGTLVRDHGNTIVVHFPERVIRPTLEEIVPGFTESVDWDEERKRWVHWSEEDYE